MLGHGLANHFISRWERSNRMQHLEFHQDHYHAGLTWGRMLAEQDLYLLDHVPFPLTEERRRFAQACLPHCQRFFPAILEETEGVAHGQRCPVEDLYTVLLTLYAMPPSCHCSCFAYCGGGQILLGRNSDFLPALEENNKNVLYHLPNVTFMGHTTSFLQMEDGLNQHGLAIGLTALAARQPQPGLHGGLVLRLLLERCTGVEDALSLLSVLPQSSAHTLTLADTTGAIALVECSPQCCAVHRPTGAPYLWATNVFCSPEMLPYALHPADDWFSAQRYQTLETALGQLSPWLDVSQAQGLLAGQYGFLCQYDRAQGKDTVWSVLYDLGQGRIYRAEGNPSRTPFALDPRFPFAVG